MKSLLICGTIIRERKATQTNCGYIGHELTFKCRQLRKKCKKQISEYNLLALGIGHIMMVGSHIFYTYRKEVRVFL